VTTHLFSTTRAECCPQARQPTDLHTAASWHCGRPPSQVPPRPIVWRYSAVTRSGANVNVHPAGPRPPKKPFPRKPACARSLPKGSLFRALPSNVWAAQHCSRNEAGVSRPSPEFGCPTFAAGVRHPACFVHRRNDFRLPFCQDIAGACISGRTERCTMRQGRSCAVSRPADRRARPLSRLLHRGELAVPAALARQLPRPERITLPTANNKSVPEADNRGSKAGWANNRLGLHDRN